MSKPVLSICWFSFSIVITLMSKCFAQIRVLIQVPKHRCLALCYRTYKIPAQGCHMTQDLQKIHVLQNWPSCNSLQYQKCLCSCNQSKLCKAYFHDTPPPFYNPPPHSLWSIQFMQQMRQNPTNPRSPSITLYHPLSAKNRRWACN